MLRGVVLVDEPRVIDQPRERTRVNKRAFSSAESKPRDASRVDEGRDISEEKAVTPESSLSQKRNG